MEHTEESVRTTVADPTPPPQEEVGHPGEEEKAASVPKAMATATENSGDTGGRHSGSGPSQKLPSVTIDPVAPGEEAGTGTRGHHRADEHRYKYGAHHRHSHGATARTKRTRRVAIGGPLRIAVFALWATAALSALTLGVVGDVFQGEQPHFPLVLVVAVKIVLDVFATILLVLLGRATKKGFAVFQPFSGGQRFALMQAAGYFTAVMAALGMVVLVEAALPSRYSTATTAAAERYGAYSVLSVFGAGAQVILVLSLLYFEPPADTASSGAAGSTQGSEPRHALSYWDLASSPAREYAFTVICLVAAVISAVLAELYTNYRPVNVLMMPAFIILAMATVASIGRQLSPSYRVLFPGVVTPLLVVVQLLANTLLFLGLCGCLILFNAQQSSPPSWHLGVALVNVMGVCVHQLLQRLTRTTRRRRSSQAAAADAASVAAADPLSPLMQEYAKEQERREKTKLHGAALSSGVSIVLTAAVYTLSVYLSVRLGPMTTGEANSEVYHAALYVSQGLWQVQSLLVLLMFALPPFTHLQGRLAFGQSYALWQPFKGSIEFILLQAAGWASYAFGIFFFPLYLSEQEGHHGFLLLLATATLLSQLFTHTSLYVFDEAKHRALITKWTLSSTAAPPRTTSQLNMENTAVFDGTVPASSGGPQGTTRSPPSCEGSGTFDALSGGGNEEDRDRPRSWSLVATVMNGEMLLAIVCWVVSMLLRGVCDTTAYTGADTLLQSGIPIRSIVHVAALFSLVATPVAQLSMRHHIPLLHVTSNSGAFHAVQCLAWFPYLALLLATVINLVTGQTHYFSCGGGYLFLEYSAHGLLHGVPLLCVIISDFCEVQERELAAVATARAKRAADALMDLVAASGAAPPTEAEKSRLTGLIRKVAGPRLSNTDWPRSVSEHGEDVPLSGLSDAAGKAGSVPSALDDVEAAVSVAAARYVSVIMCVASTLAFGSGAFLVEAAQPVVTLVFGVAGVITLSLSCISMHYVLGMRLHGHSGRYHLFMPFAGGRSFVLWQASGWTSYTVAVCLMITCLVQGGGSPQAFFLMSVFGIFAQLAVTKSIPRFNPDAELRNKFVSHNAEGILAVVIIMGSFFFARAYDMATEGGASADATALAPIVITAIALSLTVPMGLLSLQRQAQRYGVSPFALLPLDDDTDADDEEDQAFIWDDSQTTSALASPMSSSYGASLVHTTGNDASLIGGISSGVPSGLTSPHLGEGREPSASVTMATGGPSSPADRFALSGAGASLHGFGRIASASASAASIQSPAGSPLLHREVSTFARSRRGPGTAYAIAISYALSLLFALFLVLLFPFAIVLLAYAYAHDAALTYEACTHTLEILVVCFLVVMATPMIVAPIARRSRVARLVYSALSTWSVYSIPTMTVVGGTSPPFIVNTRGSYLFAFNMCSMALLSTVPHVHVVAFAFSVFCCGFFAQYHFYKCWYTGREPFVLWQCVCDLACAVFWLWYGRRFVGRPEVTGRYQSNRASRFFQRYFFEGMSHWFSLKIVVADLYTLPSEEGIITLVRKEREEELRRRRQHAVAPHDKSSGEASAGIAAGGEEMDIRSQVFRRVMNRSDPENQYLISFHPHGVFPGSAIYTPKTAQFEKLIGANKRTFISTHCADVIFSVPLMREFPLCLGALSVSLAGINHSIRAGNSPLIVTGGQSEMLLVQMSNTEMHLVCHHLGFIRVALRNRIPLVPMISFSECNIMDNVHCLKIQRWFLKRLGFPFPTLPHGFLKLPLPTRTPMTMVIGPPLMPLPGRDNWEDPACLEEMRVRYFEHLEYLFYRYRCEAGYPEIQLFLHYGVDDDGVLATPPAAGVDLATEYVLDEENSAIRRAVAAFKRNKEAAAARKAAAQAKGRPSEEQGPPAAAESTKKAQ